MIIAFHFQLFIRLCGNSSAMWLICEWARYHMPIFFLFLCQLRSLISECEIHFIGSLFSFLQWRCPEACCAAHCHLILSLACINLLTTERSGAMQRVRSDWCPMLTLTLSDQTARFFCIFDGGIRNVSHLHIDFFKVHRIVVWHFFPDRPMIRVAIAYEQACEEVFVSLNHVR